jgi:hypothetical protein
MKREELLRQVNELQCRVTSVLDGLTERQAMSVGLNAQWSVKDLLAHLTSWKERAVVELVRIENGTWQPQKMEMEAVHKFNAEVVSDRQSRSLPLVRAELEQVHEEMLRLISVLPNEVDESSPAFRVINGAGIRHVAHHAAQLERWKLKLEGDEDEKIV